MYDIVLGRSSSDVKKLGKKGTVFIGRQYVQMGQTSSLSNPIYMDVSRAHAMLICGKRGSGKSYTLGSIAEGLAEIDQDIAKNLAFVLLDTMGVYWSMKYPNKKEEDMLKKWGLEGKGLAVQTYVPGGFYNKYKEDGVPVDFPLFIQPKELSVEDWMNAFKLKTDGSVGVAVQRVINKMLDSNKNFSIDDIIKFTENDSRLEEKTKLAVINRFENCQTWGIFSKNGTPIKDIFTGGKVTVLDLSPYVAMPGGWEIKALTLGIIAKKIFVERMLVRKREELQDIVNKTQVVKQKDVQEDLPMPWLIVDECLTFDSKIQTNKGLIEIGEIVKTKNKEKLKALSFNKKTSKLEFQEITQIFNQGKKEIIEIKTNTNKTIKCTPNHKIFSKKGFIEAQNAKEIGIPINLEYNMDKKLSTARLIGHIYGDGWISAGQVGFSGDSELINLEKIKNDLKNIGFTSGKIYSRKTSSEVKNTKNKIAKINGTSFSINASTKTYNFFKKINVHEGSKVNLGALIPNYILKSSKEEKAEFLGALFGADANIPSQSNKWKSDFNPIRLVFYRAEELEKKGMKYANQIKKILSELNIKISSIKIRKGNIRKDSSKSIRFEITIAKEIKNMINFYEKIGFKYSQRKEIEAKKWLNYLQFKLNSIKEREKIKKQAIKLRKEKKLTFKEIGEKLNVPKYQIIGWCNKNYSISLPWSFPSYKNWCEKNISNNIIFNEIIHKKSKGIENVYDIEVRKNHNFIANNFLVHNCHEFLPAGDEQAPSKQALMTILREGRQPGVSLIMATQQPAKIHTDAITQSDIVMAHRLTASFDLQALDKIFLSYDNKGSKALFNSMPKTKGCAIIMDDKNERLHTMQVKPRFTWHGGEDPNAIREIKDEFEFD